MADAVLVTGERHFVPSTAALVIKTERERPREIRRDPVVNQKWKRTTKSGDIKAVLPWSLQGTEIGLMHLLIGGG